MDPGTEFVRVIARRTNAAKAWRCAGKYRAEVLATHAELAIRAVWPGAHRPWRVRIGLAAKQARTLRRVTNR